MDRNVPELNWQGEFEVALHPEGVDRNVPDGMWDYRVVMSPSTRRAWIEIGLRLCAGVQLESPSTRRAWIEIAGFVRFQAPAPVALHPEGVDRNSAIMSRKTTGIVSPSTRRAWIEI